MDGGKDYDWMLRVFWASQKRREGVCGEDEE
jgi:hypothetical protein